MPRNQSYGAGLSGDHNWKAAAIFGGLADRRRRPLPGGTQGPPALAGPGAVGAGAADGVGIAAAPPLTQKPLAGGLFFIGRCAVAADDFGNPFGAHLGHKGADAGPLGLPSMTW